MRTDDVACGARQVSQRSGSAGRVCANALLDQTPCGLNGMEIVRRAAETSGWLRALIYLLSFIGVRNLGFPEPHAVGPTARPRAMGAVRRNSAIDVGERQRRRRRDDRAEALRHRSQATGYGRQATPNHQSLGRQTPIFRLKYSIVFTRPSSSFTFGSHPRSVRALVMSGWRTLGSSTGKS